MRAIASACMILIIVVTLAGCNGNAVKSEKKGDYTVEFLFEQDGCKMYRFSDGGISHYFLTPAGEVITKHAKRAEEDVITPHT